MYSHLAHSAALMAALLASAPTLAADWYTEFHAGTTRVDHQDPAVTGEGRTEGAYGIGVGVEFGKYFSTQLDWHTLGENPDVVSPPCPVPPCAIAISVVMPEHGWALRATPRWPIGDEFALELGIGLMRWEGDQSVDGMRFSDDGTDRYLSLGFVWRFAEDWSLTAEVQDLDHEYLDFSWTGATLRYAF